MKALANIFGFKIWSADVNLAYLQSSEPLERKMYIPNPVPELNLSYNGGLVLPKTLYGLSDSGDLWYISFDNHMKKYLRMKPVITDPVLNIKLNKLGELIEIHGSYVHDFL